MDYTLPESFTVNNDCYHKRDCAEIVFNLAQRFDRSGVYKRTEDTVQQFGYNTLRTADKWAVKYYVTPERSRNQYFTSKAKAIKFAESHA